MSNHQISRTSRAVSLGYAPVVVQPEKVLEAVKALGLDPDDVVSIELSADAMTVRRRADVLAYTTSKAGLVLRWLGSRPGDEVVGE